MSFSAEDNQILRATVSMGTSSDLIYVLFKEQVVDEEKNIQRARLIVEDIYAVYQQHPDTQFKILVNMTAMGPGHISSEARSIYMEALKHPQTRYVAMVGEPFTQMAVVSFILPFFIGPDKKVAWFDAEEKARMWLGVVR